MGNYESLKTEDTKSKTSHSVGDIVDYLFQGIVVANYLALPQKEAEKAGGFLTKISNISDKREARLKPCRV